MYFSLADKFPHWLDWTNQIHRWKNAKSWTFSEKKWILSLQLAAAKELTTQNELTDQITELTDQICVHTHFSYWQRPANFHHTINGQGTQRIAGYPNTTIKFCVKGLNHCLLFFHFKLQMLTENLNLLYISARKFHSWNVDQEVTQLLFVSVNLIPLVV